MALPGTPGQRISDLCNGNHITQKQLAKKIGVSASQLSRIVSGETKTVSSDILIGVAKEFKVSTDYILGLSNISVRKSYDISELGLSEGGNQRACDGYCGCANPQPAVGTQEFPETDGLDTDLLSRHCSKGHHSTKPTNRVGNGFPV